MNAFLALEECPGCGFNLDLVPELSQVDFTGKGFFDKKETDAK